MNGDEELKKLLKENLDVSQESLKILKGIRRSNRVSAVFRFIYWLVIIGAALGLYYYLQPYLSQVPALWNQVQNIQKMLPKQ
jgi:hypothetical protein